MTIKIINIVMGLLAAAGVGLFLFGRAFANRSSPEITEWVHLSPIVLFVLSLVLQTILVKTDRVTLVLFLPLLYIPLLLLAFGYMNNKNENYKENTLTENRKVIESYLNLAPTGTFTQNPEYYLVRLVKDTSDEKIVFVALTEPFAKIVDVWGNTDAYGMDGLTFYLIWIKGQKTSIQKSPFIKGLTLNRYQFSNVGYYKEQKIESNPNELPFNFYEREVGLKINLNESEVLSFNGKTAKVELVADLLNGK